MSNRLPETKCLSDILPKGREGGLEFARLVDLLLFYEARRQGQNMMLFSDRAGDYAGLDSFGDGPTRQHGRVGYQYKFYPSPLSTAHRSEIKQALAKAKEARTEQKPSQRIKKWVLVTPDDLTESAQRKDLGDVSWFNALRTELKLRFEIEHFGHRKLQALLMATPTLCLFYWPELIPQGAARRRSIEEVRLQYDTNLTSLYDRIEFVGMSVYKPEATKGVPMEHIYIPLTTVAAGADDREPNTPRNKPLTLLKPGSRHVILGDPGSGKSTLLKFIALAGLSAALQQRYTIQPDTRLPILVVLRKYADALKTTPDLPLLDYILANLRADFSLQHADLAFLEYYLESGNAILLFDGMDELPNPGFKQTVRDRIHCLLNNYPASAAVITSRIIGYENPYRFDDKSYHHHKLARLSLTEMADFVRDWYAVRVENEGERKANITDLVRILQDEQQSAIRELASNPLLLTIIALVHRIDAVLPDERVVLYQKCTETLLNTWHVWKSADKQLAQRGKIERRNRNRIEALAHWMHVNAGETRANQRAVVPHQQALQFLVTYIQQHEQQVPQDDAEDVAEEFLTFIKNSAGLLIEVGDRQYSFIHLTFQEYLTATWLAAKMERSGAEKLWEMIAQYVTDPRWQEVIRLLIAGMRNDESQEFLCGQLLAMTVSKPGSQLALLLGGLLQDGVGAAELNGAEIAQHLFTACAAEQEPELLNRLVMLAKALLARTQNWLEQGYSLAFAKATDPTRMVLAGFAVGFGQDQLQALANSPLTQPQFEVLNYLLTPNATAAVSQSLAAQLKLHYAELAVFATTDEWPNMLAAMAEAVLRPKQLAYSAFNLRFFLITNMANGPFAHFGHHLGLMHANLLPGSRADEPALARERAQKAAGAVAGPGSGAATRAGARARARARARAEARAGGHARALRDTITQALLEIDQPKALPKSNSQRAEKVWAAIQTNKEFTNDLLELCITGLKLKPTPLWKEALRTAFLPQVPTRLWLYHPETWQQVETCFADGSFDENDTYAAAWILLHDIWLFFYETHTGPTDSRFARLAELTRQHPAPQLQIAHCLRDITYGNRAREDDLDKMMADPAFATILRDAMWID